MKLENKKILPEYRLLNAFIGKNGKEGIEGKLEQKKRLIDYLSRYNDIYEYCKDWYLWYDESNETDVKDFIDKNILVEASKRAIKTVDDVKRYMDIAEFFWELRKKHYLRVGKTETELDEVNKKIAEAERYLT